MRNEPQAEIGTSPAIGGLEDLYVRHAPEAVRLAFLLTRDAALAEDLVQDAFIRVAGRFRHLRDPGAVESYVRRAVVNLAMSHHRHQKVARSHVEREGAAVVRQHASMPDIETRDELREGLLALPLRQRVAVVLRYYGDLPEEHVAQAMRCSVTAARSLVFRGMQTLRTQIGDER